MSLLSDLGALGTAVYGFDQGIQNVQDSGRAAQTLSQTLGDQAVSRSRFKPFSVSSNTGTAGASVGADGSTSLDMQLSPEMMAGVQGLREAGSGFLSKATGDTAQREGDVFARLEAMLNPSRERDQLALEERLFNQGRSGVATSQFGGTPESLALNKAIEESKLQSAVQAIGISNQEQAQNFGFADTAAKTSLLPEQQLMQLFGSGLQTADLVNLGDRQGAEIAAKLGQTGLEAQTQSEGIAGNLQVAQMKALMEILSGANGAGGGILDGIAGLFNWGSGGAAQDTQAVIDSQAY